MLLSESVATVVLEYTLKCGMCTFMTVYVFGEGGILGNSNSSPKSLVAVKFWEVLGLCFCVSEPHDIIS